MPGTKRLQSKTSLNPLKVRSNSFKDEWSTWKKRTKIERLQGRMLREIGWRSHKLQRGFKGRSTQLSMMSLYTRGFSMIKMSFRSRGLTLITMCRVRILARLSRCLTSDTMSPTRTSTRWTFMESLSSFSRLKTLLNSHKLLKQRLVESYIKLQ